MKKPIILTILDGYGLREEKHGNAIQLADNKIFNYLWRKYPHTELIASGQEVGLPRGQMGNSEVGHMNIGAGRVVYQPLELINKAIEEKRFFSNEKILEVMNHVKKNDSKLHIFGLLSNGGVHSHINHLFALIDMCQKENINNVYYHIFLDGRDTLPDMKEQFLNELQEKLNETPIGKIGTISGRYYAMDRDNRWDRVELAYNAIVNSEGEKYQTIEEFIEHNKKENITDEFVVPAIIDKNSNIEDNDGLIVFNFRPDRLRELFMAITNPNFNDFNAKKFTNIKLVTMMKVSEDVITTNAFKIEELNNTLGEYVANYNKKQLRIAETEKYAHVTYFFDGGIERELDGCERILISSPKVPTYDIKPDMSAVEVTERLLQEIDKYDLIILNFANGDMVGHTGILEAAITAVETVDKCLEKIYNKIKELDGIMIVTADHGNCEEMLDENNNVLTAHTTNLVPFIITEENIALNTGKLCDIAPTILELMEIPQPKEMTGTTLIKK